MNLSQEIIQRIFDRLEEQNPNPQTELVYTNVFTFTLAVVLSAQSTDKGVNRATETLFKRVSCPQHILDLGEDALRNSVKTIGLYRNKSAYIMELSRQWLDRWGNDGSPQTRDEWESLPGVGRKTANVIMNEIDQAPVVAVDTHVFRVARRLGLSDGKTPRAVERDLDFSKIISLNQQRNVHRWLVLHGRYVCLARAPKCGTCVIHDYCRFRKGEV